MEIHKYSISASLMVTAELSAAAFFENTSMSISSALQQILRCNRVCTSQMVGKDPERLVATKLTQKN
jgi:hypothetical protein